MGYYVQKHEKHFYSTFLMFLNTVPPEYDGLNIETCCGGVRKKLEYWILVRVYELVILYTPFYVETTVYTVWKCPVYYVVPMLRCRFYPRISMKDRKNVKILKKFCTHFSSPACRQLLHNAAHRQLKLPHQITDCTTRNKLGN
jgi:hypothetical protein